MTEKLKGFLAEGLAVVEMDVVAGVGDAANGGVGEVPEDGPEIVVGDKAGVFASEEENGFEAPVVRPKGWLGQLAHVGRE